MLTINRKGWLSRDVELRDGSASVADISFPSSLSDRAEIRVEGTTYESRRAGWVSSKFQLARGDDVVITAEPVGFWQQSYEVRQGSSLFTLKRAGFLHPRWLLLDGDSEVGVVEREGFWRTRLVPRFDARADAVMQAFVVWLVTSLWRKEAAAGVAVASS